jgi:hypothetical protein
MLSLAAIGTYKHGNNPDTQGIRAACRSIGRKFIFLSMPAIVGRDRLFRGPLNTRIEKVDQNVN